MEWPLHEILTMLHWSWKNCILYFVCCFKNQCNGSTIASERNHYIITKFSSCLRIHDDPENVTFNFMCRSCLTAIEFHRGNLSLRISVPSSYGFLALQDVLVCQYDNRETFFWFDFAVPVLAWSGCISWKMGLWHPRRCIGNFLFIMDQMSAGACNGRIGGPQYHLCQYASQLYTLNSNYIRYPNTRVGDGSSLPVLLIGPQKRLAWTKRNSENKKHWWLFSPLRMIYRSKMVTEYENPSWDYDRNISLKIAMPVYS